MTGDKEYLLREADRLEALVAELPAISGGGLSDEWRTSHRRHRDAVETLARTLTDRASPRATIRDNGNTASMSMLGVRATCTSGLAGLFRNWIAAARRKAMQ